MAVAHLVPKGHSRIALINGWENERRRGTLAVLETGAFKSRTAGAGGTDGARRLDFCPEATPRHRNSLTCNSRRQQGGPAKLLMMTGLVKALKERKIACPSHVEVMSSDETPSGWMFSNDENATVSQPSYEMGSKAAQTPPEAHQIAEAHQRADGTRSRTHEPGMAATRRAGKC